MNYEELEALGRTLAQVGENEQRISDIIGRMKKAEAAMPAESSEWMKEAIRDHERRISIYEARMDKVQERFRAHESMIRKAAKPAPEFKVGYPVEVMPDVLVVRSFGLIVDMDGGGAYVRLTSGDKLDYNFNMIRAIDTTVREGEKPVLMIGRPAVIWPHHVNPEFGLVTKITGDGCATLRTADGCLQKRNRRDLRAIDAKEAT